MTDLLMIMPEEMSDFYDFKCHPICQLPSEVVSQILERDQTFELEGRQRAVMSLWSIFIFFQ